MTDRPGPGGGRSALRRRRRRQRRLAIVLVLGLGVLAAVVVTVFLARRDPPLPPVTVERGRTQQTLLLQLEGDDGAAVGAALLAHDPAIQEGAGLLVPPQVLAAPAGSDAVPFGQVLRTGPAGASRRALGDLTGVTVDAGWVLDRAATAGLVDAVAGVSVQVDVPVLGGLDGRTVLVPAGAQRLAGADAVAYATYLAPGELEQARLARLQQLLDGLLERLPAADGELAALLGGLGPGSVPDRISLAGLADLLAGLAADDQASALQYDTLPVLQVETGAPQASLRVDPEATRVVVDRLLAQSVPPRVREGGNRVKVFNGVGTPFLGDRARDQLVAGGLVYVPGGNASRFGVVRTQVQIGEATESSLELGARVARALGVPADAVRTSPPTTVADVIVVIGADFL